MPIPDTFLAGCRAAVEDSPAYSAFAAAGAVAATATRAERDAQWGALYAPGPAGTSPASRLRAEIRGLVNARADAAAASSGTVVTPGEREAVYATLVGEYAPAVPRPVPAASEYAELTRLIAEDEQS